MIKYSSSLQKQSAITNEDGSLKFPEVTFTVRRFSHGLRSKIRADLSPALAKIRDKTDEINALVEEGGFNEEAPSETSTIVALDESMEEKDPDAAPPVLKKTKSFSLEQQRIIERINDLNNHIEIITANDVDPVYMRHGFISITGIEINGAKVPDWKTVYEHGPEELCYELVRTIKEQAGLTNEVKENLESPSTSGAQADGQNLNTNAPDAKQQDGTGLAIVANSSQAT